MTEPGAGFAIVGAAGVPAPADLVQALRACGHVLRVRAGQMPVAAGTPSDDVYLVEAGQLRVTLFSAEGREVIMRDLGPGRFVGDLAAIDGGRRSTSVVALEDSRLLLVAATDFRTAVLATPARALWFAGHLAAQVRALTERLMELSTLNVRGRLHSHLLRLCAMAGVEGNRARLDPFPTHEELATMIGTHREAVTRELSALAAAGIVTPARRRLEVHDVERLAGLVRQAAGTG